MLHCFISIIRGLLVLSTSVTFVYGHAGAVLNRLLNSATVENVVVFNVRLTVVSLVCMKYHCLTEESAEEMVALT